MIDLGRRKGYTPVCFNQNTAFVLEQYADRFAGIQNDAVSLWRDAWRHESDEFRTELTRFRRGCLVRAVEGKRFEGSLGEDD